MGTQGDLAEQAKRAYDAFWADVPSEATEGLDRLIRADKELDAAAQDAQPELARRFFRMPRASDFTAKHHARFRVALHARIGMGQASRHRGGQCARPTSHSSSRATRTNSRGSPSDDPHLGDHDPPRPVAKDRAA
jgi:hypothetical protein